MRFATMPTMAMDGTLFTFVLGLLFVALPLMIGGYLLGKHVIIRRRWVRRSAEVVKESWMTGGSADGGSGNLKRFTIRWVDDAGRAWTFSNPIGHTGWGVLRSTPYPVEVYVDPKDPTRGVMARGMGSYGAVGTVLIATAVVLAPIFMMVW